jgi:outer membrane protein OmpA-like peptidoglycan-associated protein
LTEAETEIGIGAGAEVKVSDNFVVYANVNYYGAQRYENIYGNAGVRYIFGRVKRENKILKENETEEITQAQLNAAQERRQKPIIKSYKINIANFESNEYNLTAKAKEIIKSQAKEISEFEYKKITIEGHADITGTDAINDKLSRERARSVYKEFLLNGIPAEKTNYIGFGSRIPIDSNKTKSGRAANRRTEIFVE